MTGEPTEIAMNATAQSAQYQMGISSKSMPRPYALSAPSVNGMDSTDARKLSILACMGES